MKTLSTQDAAFESAFLALLAEARETTEDVAETVRTIIADVKSRGDAALCDYTTRFDRFALTPERIAIEPAEIDAAVAAIPAPLMAALELAARLAESPAANDSTPDSRAAWWLMFRNQKVDIGSPA